MAVTHTLTFIALGASVFGKLTPDQDCVYLMYKAVCLLNISVSQMGAKARHSLVYFCIQCCSLSIDSVSL